MLNGAPILGTKMMVRRFSTGDVTFGCPRGAHLRGPTLFSSSNVHLGCTLDASRLGHTIDASTFKIRMYKTKPWPSTLQVLVVDKQTSWIQPWCSLLQQQLYSMLEKT
jgi:hypothetical protein